LTSRLAARKAKKITVLVHNQLKNMASKKPNAPSPSCKSIGKMRLTSQPGTSTIQFKKENLKAAVRKATPDMPLQIARASFVSQDMSRFWLICSTGVALKPKYTLSFLYLYLRILLSAAWKNSHMRQDPLEFHIQENDYFGTLATVLDLIRQDLHRSGYQRHAVALGHLRDDLMHLQKQ